MKLFKWIGKLIGFILVLLIIALVFCVYLIYDGNNEITNEYIKEEVTFEEEINRLAVKALSDTKGDSCISFEFNEAEINVFTYALTKEINEKLSSLPIKINGIELRLNKDHSIELYSHLNVMLFPSSLRGVVTITSNDEFITLKVEKISLAKISLDDKTVVSIITKYITSDKVNQILTEAGLDLNVDLKTLTIKLNISEFVEKYASTLSTGSDGDLYSALIDLVLQEKIIEFNFNTNEKLGANINLSSLSYIASSDGSFPVDYSSGYDEVENKLEVLIRNNIIDYSNVSKVYYYLINGYKKVKDEDGFDFIKNLDLSSVGISDYKDYQGIKNEKLSILSILEDQAPSPSLIQTGLLNFRLSEQNLNSILMDISAVDTTYAFYIKEDETIEIAVIYIEAIYADITEDKMSLKCVFNVNGKQIILTVYMSESSSTGLGINADLNDIYIGNIKASEDMENKILVFLEDALKEEPLISVDSQNKTFTISLDSYFEDLSFYSLIKQIMHAETSFDVLSEHDCININISLNN